MSDGGQSESDDPVNLGVSKDPRSKAKYNIFSRILFLWLEPLLWDGCRRPLYPSDLYEHPAEADSSVLLEKFKRRCGKTKSLFSVLLKTFGWRIALQAALQFTEKCLLVGQSIVLGYLTDYFREPCTQNSREAYLYVMGLSVMVFATILVYTHGSLSAQKTGMMARVMCTAAIYDKITRTAINMVPSGQVINLASNDVQKLDYAFLFLHYLWLGPLYIIVYTYLVYQEVGPPAFLATGFVVIQIPLQIVIAKLFAFFKQHSSEMTDKRVSLMKETISAIKVIKMYTWENAFLKAIQTIRMQESQSILKSSLIRATNFALFTVSLTIIGFLVFSVYTGTGGTLTPKKVFTILALTATLRVSSIHFFVLAILNLSDTIVAVTRIQTMLQVDSAELQSDALSNEQIENAVSGSVVVENLSVSWDVDTTANPTLSNISFNVPKGRCVSIIGSVGSGKSTLLHCLLGELKPMEGTVAVNGVVSYASQKPWVFSGTVKENILFGSPFDTDRYNAVVQACALNKDIDGFANGELTVIGDSGVSLSGGQKARVSLARAVYRKANIYLLDDPLSAVDTAVARHLFESCICGVLKDNTVLLVTNQLQFVLKTEQIMVLNNGKMVACCSPQQLKEKEIDPSKLLDLREDDEYLYKESTEDDEDESGTDDTTSDEAPEQRRIASTVPRAYRKVSYSHEGPQDAVLEGQPTDISNQRRKTSTSMKPTNTQRGILALKRQGAEASSATMNAAKLDHPQNVASAKSLTATTSLSSLGGRPDRVSIGRRPSNINRPVRVSTVSNTNADNFLKNPRKFSIFSVISSLSQRTSIGSIYSSVTSEHSEMDEDGESSLDKDRDLFIEEKSRNRVSIRTYFNYFRAGGSYIGLLMLTAIFILGEGSSITADVWIAQWTGYNSSCSNSTPAAMGAHEMVAVYSAITASTIFFNFARIIIFFWVAHRAASTLHSQMLSALLEAVPRFFDAIPIGQILSRFSKDMSFLDDLLPFMLCEYLILLLRCIAVLLTAASANNWIFLPAAALIVALLILRTYYLRTAKQIKWLESSARSPLYSHLSSTLDGLVTIRVFGQNSKALQHFHDCQNQHSKAWYLQLVSTRWFGMRVDAVGSFLITLVAIISVPLSMELDAAIVGLGLTYTLTLSGSLQYCIRLSGDTENVMLSAERLMQLSRLVPEVPEVQSDIPCTTVPPPDWPQKGEIELQNVSFCYNSHSPLVLKSISCHIKPAEKIGIVGRTGAGKSSLISMLYRMAQPQGLIIIDGISANGIGLHQMRSRLSIIPQEPVLFSGTVRFNLDPTEKYQDAELWNVLEKVQLKTTVEQLNGGLDSLVCEGGCNFSIGQRQLMCLARALLKKSKILVVDEATANVDVRTDGIIQALIRSDFSDCTVLTIAHRLNTIMDSDRILVLNRGRVKEFDSPYLLLSDRASLLRKMVKQTGSVAALKLQRMAYDAYVKKSASRNTSAASSQRLLESIEERDQD